MKTRSVVLTFLLSVLALTGGIAEKLNLGTWKLNETKSSIPPGTGKSTTVVYAPGAGDTTKITTAGVDASGKPTHTQWMGKFDAKPYPVSGDRDAPYRAHKVKNEHSLLFANMNGDRTVSNGKIQVAKDGKSRTVEMTYFESKKIKAKYVYEKQ